MIPAAPPPPVSKMEPAKHSILLPAQTAMEPLACTELAVVALALALKVMEDLTAVK